MFRHGDYLFIPLPLAQKLHAAELAKPAASVDRDANGDVIFGYGETTGHMHVIADAERLVDAELHGDIMVVNVKHPTLIQHVGYEGPRDHRDIPLPQGEWAVIHQVEYSPVLEAVAAPVID